MFETFWQGRLIPETKVRKPNNLTTLARRSPLELKRALTQRRANPRTCAPRRRPSFRLVGESRIPGSFRPCCRACVLRVDGSFRNVVRIEAFGRPPITTACHMCALTWRGRAASKVASVPFVSAVMGGGGARGRRISCRTSASGAFGECCSLGPAFASPATSSLSATTSVSALLCASPLVR